MIVLVYRGISLDWCEDCQGVFLDRDELADIVQASGDKADTLIEALGTAKESARSGRTRMCPRCDEAMRIVSLGGEPVIHLDRCPACRGLWFDRSELPATVARYAGQGSLAASAISDFFSPNSPHPESEK